LVMLTFELASSVNNKVVYNFLRFQKSIGSSLFEAYNFSYG
jgi:hypothetical protein